VDEALKGCGKGNRFYVVAAAAVNWLRQVELFFHKFLFHSQTAQLDTSYHFLS